MQPYAELELGDSGAPFPAFTTATSRGQSRPLCPLCPLEDKNAGETPALQGANMPARRPAIAGRALPAESVSGPVPVLEAHRQPQHRVDDELHIDGVVFAVVVEIGVGVIEDPQRRIDDQLHVDGVQPRVAVGVTRHPPV